MKKEYITKNSTQTKKLGEKFAREILEKKPALTRRGRPALTRRGRPQRATFIIGLEGELGGGKTTFLQGFAGGLGIKEKILSPTFVILKKFKIPKRKNVNWFYHIDCYRIKKPKELLDLGFKEISSNPKNIVVIEWAGQIRKIMPKNSAWIKFDFVDKKTRKIIFFGKF